MSKIETKQELLEKVGINSIDDIAKPQYLDKFTDIVKNDNISNELLKDVIQSVPDLKGSFNSMFKAMSDIGGSLEETKRTRWNILQNLAEKDKLTAEQFMEAMKLLQEIEKNEKIDWTLIFKTVGVALATAAGLVFAIIRKKP